jgi:hypothetical protein
VSIVGHTEVHTQFLDLSDFDKVPQFCKNIDSEVTPINELNNPCAPTRQALMIFFAVSTSGL